MRGDAAKLDFELNPEFDGKLVIESTRHGSQSAPGLKFTVVGPMKPELQALQKKHDEWLEDEKRMRTIPKPRLRRTSTRRCRIYRASSCSRKPAANGCC